MKRRTVLIGAAAAAAVVTGAIAAYPLLRGREKLLATRVISPTSSNVVEGVLRCDFGRVWFGNLSIGPGLHAGSRLLIRMGEKLGRDGRIDRSPPGTVRYYETTITAGDGVIRPVLTEADRRGLQAYGRPAMPFRFAEIEGLGAHSVPVKLEAVVSSQYRQTGHLHFSGADDRARQLNRLVELGFRTMETTSFMGIFVDGDRERLPYEADGYINQLGWYVATSDTTVPRRTLETLLAKPTWPSEWMIQLIFIAWADYMMSGDKAYLSKVVDRLPIFALGEFVDQSGLVTTATQPLNKDFVRKVGADYLEDIVDWPKPERDGYEMLPYNTVVNAFVFQGQTLLAEMYSELGRQDRARRHWALADRLRGAIVEKLVDPADGLFVDGLGSTHKSAHATFFPLAFGLTPPANVAAALEHIGRRTAVNEDGFPCSVYGAQYLLDGLFRAGAGEQALKLMLNSGRRGWLNMLDAHDATVTHEAWDPAFKENIDWTHAWGAAFFSALQRHVVGARPVRPGWRQWVLQPQMDRGLSAEAKIPTPHGIIDVTVDGSRKALSVVAPSAARLVEDNAFTGDWKLASIRYRD